MNKKNTIRLTESDFKRVISESVNKALRESSWQTASKAYNKSREFSHEFIMKAYDKFEIVTNELINFLDNGVQGQELKVELKSLMSKIKRYCERKYKQDGNLHNHAIDSFEKHFGASHDVMKAHMDALDDKYGDDFHDASWRRDNLSDKERELYDYEGWK